MFWLNTAHAKSTFLPPQASNFASSVDALYDFLYYSSLISCILVIGGLILFALFYKRKSDSDKTPYISHNAALEFLWSFVPFVVFIVIFAWGWKIFYDMRRPPENALEIHVEAKRWDWTFMYKSGKKSVGEFTVPVGEPVRLIMSSRDVLHSFFVPAFRIKQDVIPGRYTALWFEATKIGTFNVFCTEYCGLSHSAMLAKVNVVSRDDYEAWIQDDPYKGLSLVDIGQKVYSQQCTACHNITAEKKIGPGFKGLFGATRKFTDGTTGVADENYIRESILYPNRKRKVGFENANMNSFQGLLSEDELRGVISYLKTLK